MPTGPIAGVPAHTLLPASGEQPYISVPSGGTIYLPAGAQIPGTSMFDPDDLDRPVTPDQPSTRLLRPPRWSQWQVNGATGGATSYSFAIVATSGDGNDSLPTALLVATGAQAALSGANNIQLNWGFVPGAAGFKVLYWNGTIYQLIAQVGPGVLTYQVTTVAALPTYTPVASNPLAPQGVTLTGQPQVNTRLSTSADVVTTSGQYTVVGSWPSNTYSTTISLFTTDLSKNGRLRVDINVTAITGILSVLLQSIAGDAATYFTLGQVRNITATGKYTINVGSGVTDHVPDFNPGIFGGDSDYGFSGDISSKVLITGLLSGASPSVTGTFYAFAR